LTKSGTVERHSRALTSDDLSHRLTEAERAALEKAAAKEWLEASTWARRVLLLEAGRVAATAGG